MIIPSGVMKCSANVTKAEKNGWNDLTHFLPAVEGISMNERSQKQEESNKNQEFCSSALPPSANWGERVRRGEVWGKRGALFLEMKRAPMTRPKVP